jgi:hypothetical protein
MGWTPATTSVDQGNGGDSCYSRDLRAQERSMARGQSRLAAEIDFDRNGKQHGFIRLPYSVHRSAYGWIPIPVASIKNGKGPRILLMAGNHGDEYEGQVALGCLPWNDRRR